MSLDHLILRPGQPQDAATAAALLLESGGELLRAGFGFAPDGDIARILSAAWPLAGHPLSAAHATVAELHGRVVGLLVCTTAEERDDDGRSGGHLFSRLVPDRVRRRLPRTTGTVPAPPRDALFIGSIAVVPAWRRRGIASRLLREAEARGRTADCRALALDVLESNTAARRLYEREGFHQLTTWRWPHPRVPEVLRLLRGL